MFNRKLGLALGFCLIAPHAWADWEFTKWNMTEEALKQAGQSRHVNFEPTTSQEKEDYSGPVIIDPTGQRPDHTENTAELKANLPAYFNSIAYFIFDMNKKLVQVSLVIPRDQCVPFGQAMAASNGKPVLDHNSGGPGGLIDTIWVSKKKDSIEVTWANQMSGSPTVGQVCNIKWTPQEGRRHWYSLIE